MKKAEVQQHVAGVHYACQIWYQAVSASLPMHCLPKLPPRQRMMWEEWRMVQPDLRDLHETGSGNDSGVDPPPRRILHDCQETTWRTLCTVQGSET
jgi:hypothetical protein